MAEEGYQDFLIETAGVVDIMIANHCCKEQFRQQAELFITKHNQWQEALGESLKTAKKEGRVFKYTHKQWRRFTNDGYEIYAPDNCPDDIDLSSISGHIALKLPLNPVWLLCPQDVFKEVLPSKGDIVRRRPANDAENILRQCFLLAVIHAKKSTSPPIIDTQCQTIHEVWSFWGDMGNNYLEKKKRMEIMSALAAVKEYLEDGKEPAEWSKPMSKTRMMNALGIDSIDTFNSYAERVGIRPINRKIHQIRLDKMQQKDREKLEKK